MLSTRARRCEWATSFFLTFSLVEDWVWCWVHVRSSEVTCRFFRGRERGQCNGSLFFLRERDGLTIIRVHFPLFSSPIHSPSPPFCTALSVHRPSRTRQALSKRRCTREGGGANCLFRSWLSLPTLPISRRSLCVPHPPLSLFPFKSPLPAPFLLSVSPTD